MKGNEREYVKINPSDFSEYSFPHPHTAESILRSIEHYLVKNSIPNNLEGDSRIIYVEGKNEAIRLGQYFQAHFGVNKIWYFNGEVLSVLPVIRKEDKRRAPRATVVDIASGEKVSLRKYKKDAQNEIDQKYISFKDISGRKIISPAKLEKLVLAGSLKAVDIGGKRYVDKAELLKFLNKKAE